MSTVGKQNIYLGNKYTTVTARVYKCERPSYYSKMVEKRNGPFRASCENKLGG